MNHIFAKELEELINKHSMENGSNTQDFILSTYLCDCLRAFDEATKERDRCRKGGPFDDAKGSLDEAPKDVEIRSGMITSLEQSSGFKYSPAFQGLNGCKCGTCAYCQQQIALKKLCDRQAEANS